MDIIISSENKGDHLLITSSGIVHGKEELFEHAVLVYQETIKHDQRKILIDDRQTIFPLDMFSYYHQVEFFSKNLPADIHELKIAVVFAPGFEEVGKFWETVAVNRGFLYFAFTSMEKAHNWLLS